MADRGEHRQAARAVDAAGWVIELRCAAENSRQNKMVRMSDFATKTISSWDEFYKIVLGQQSEGREWIYRGQPKAWPLKTTIERALDNWAIDLGEATSIEFQTIREFRRRMCEPRHHRVHEDTLFCLALMRHHGAPTRLLDCTYSAFVAAAFAMEQGCVCTEPAIWCLRAHWFEDEVRKAFPDLLELLERRDDDSKRNDDTFVELYQLERHPPTDSSKRRKFVKPENPFYLNERLTAQQGVFLCPGDLKASFVDNLTAMDGFHLESNAVKLSLSLTKKEAIEFVCNLKNMNLSFAALFPDLDGFARSIGQQIFHYQKLAGDRAGLPKKRTSGRPIGFR
jgi:hypothetical protein